MLNKSDELKDRINARKLELAARLAELKADTRHEAIEASDKLKTKLADLEENIKDGWDKMSDAVREKLNKWLDN